MTIQRTIFKNIEKNLFVGKEKKPVIVIYGPRQSGKTTLVKQILAKYSEKAEYFNCDFIDVQERFAYKNIQNIKDLISGFKLIILDEAQRIENIGLVLKILVDNYPNLQVIATGSSSFDLSNKIKEPLTGRKVEFHLFPFSFEELNWQKNSLEQKRELQSLLRFGSYPAIINKSEEEKIGLLKEITSSYLFKDVFTFQELKKPELLISLLRLLAFQVGSEVSFNELARQLKVDQTVIQRYIFLLESAFVIFRLGAFKRNLRSEVSKSRKIYFWDLGIRNTLIQNYNNLELRNDVGALWKNFCVAERLKLLANHNKSVNNYFWRTYTQKEIDYLEESGGKLNTFEFKWSPDKKTTLPADFVQEYGESCFTVVNPDNFTKFIIS